MREVSLYAAKQGKQYSVEEVRARGLEFWRGPHKVLEKYGLRRGADVEKMEKKGFSNLYNVRVNGKCHLISSDILSKVFVLPKKDTSSEEGGLEGCLDE
ncbi:MAG: FeoA family protein [Candidatus Woesearchaeota archaeon]